MTNKYLCLYDGHTAEVEATTSYNAQIAGYNVFKGKFPRRHIKAHQITPCLIEKEGKEVIHSTASIG